MDYCERLVTAGRGGGEGWGRGLRVGVEGDVAAVTYCVPVAAVVASRYLTVCPSTGQLQSHDARPH